MKKIIGLLTLLLAGATAHASLTLSKMDMENHMRDRVQTIASKADPTAFAQVSIKLKKIRSNLSFLGMETHVTPLENGQDIGPESIDSIEVKVLSKLDPFPEWLKKEISASVEVEGLKVNVTYAKPDSPMKDFTAQLSEFFSEDLYASLNGAFKNLKWGLWILGFLFTFGLVGIGWALLSFSQKLEATLQKVIAENLVPMATALGQMAGGTNKAAQVAPKEKSQESQPSRITVEGSGSKNQFKLFPAAAMEALFIDCYWTKLDGYAHYLWTQLNPAQREALMKSGAVDVEYFSHVINVAPRQEDYHSHAWYMNPHKKFNNIDQKTLTGWVKQHLDAAYMVSPLRLDYVELTLEERLKIAANTKRATVEVKAFAPSAPRVFAPKLRLKSLTEADELYLFNNHDKINSDARAQLKSLVWLAVAPQEQRRKILDQMDARQLAEAWAGPKPVLDRLKESLSAKKQEMLEHFLRDGQANRDSDVYAYLVEAGLEASQAAPVLKAAA
jgi:hypothetical protein